MSETKHEKFVRIATARANKAADAIRLLGQCSNTATYYYTEEDKKKIFAYLRKTLKETERRFEANNAPKKLELHIDEDEEKENGD